MLDRITNLFRPDRAKDISFAFPQEERLSPIQWRLQGEALDNLSRYKEALKAKGVDLKEIEENMSISPSLNIKTGDRDVWNFALACLRLYNNEDKEGRPKSTVVLKIGSDFDMKKAYEDMFEQITGERRTFGDEYTIEFDEAIGKHKFNIVLDIQDVSALEKLQRFQHCVRSRVQHDEAKLLIFLGEGVNSDLLPSEIMRCF